MILDLQVLLEFFGLSFCCRHCKETVPVDSLEAVTKGIVASLNFCCTSLLCRHEDMARAERCTKCVTTKLTSSPSRKVELNDPAIDD